MLGPPDRAAAPCVRRTLSPRNAYTPFARGGQEQPTEDVRRRGARGAFPHVLVDVPAVQCLAWMSLAYSMHSSSDDTRIAFPGPNCGERFHVQGGVRRV